MHTVRIPEDLWRRAQAAARRADKSVSELIRELLERYLAEGDEPGDTQR